MNKQITYLKKKTKHDLAEAWIRENESKIYEVYTICSITYLNKKITYLSKFLNLNHKTNHKKKKIYDLAEAWIWESESRERIPDLAVQSKRVRESETDEYERLREHSIEPMKWESIALSTETPHSTESTTIVSEGFESERMKEKNRFENLRLGLLVKSKTVSFGPLLFFLFFYFL